ncbi:HNH endonuclease [Bacteroides sp. 14(A)]|uniref:HNH endonuclease n=1 Tax=Bacteroides sp. 14(A) TaxID=1163670 RepID=UPI000494AFD5|nr:HNH endonuclease [Bacteroides sp. 14(A)]
MDNVLNVNTQFKKKDIDIFLTSRKKPYLITAEQVIEYWDKKNWLTVKGEKIKSIAALVNVANSYLTENKRKECLLPAIDETNRRNRQNEWSQKRSQYYDQLEMPQWKSYREFIFTVRGRKCEICGNEKKLNIHHVKYINNRFAWEYLPSDVLVVCESCHRNIHKIPH